MRYIGISRYTYIFVVSIFSWLVLIQMIFRPALLRQSRQFPNLRLQWRPNATRLPKFFSNQRASKWIVVTSIQLPTEDIKRLAALPGWSLVVVGDGKTPEDWNLPGVHFLSLAQQDDLGFASVRALPQGSYTRKNAGYLYAIANGAEWIYDTDDDNKPYGMGLDQFDYNDVMSGIRFQDYDPAFRNVTTDIRLRLFNPYRHFGAPQMWPRGFPLEHFSQHTHDGMYRLCHTMRTAAVQQGIVHKDPDVDAIYRLLKADPESGLNVRFNTFAPPVTLAPGTYAPWNSQNTLFHRRAFFGLFLPTSVAFRVTDIWRSFFTQKLLHLLGESVSFVPVNAIQIRNAHDYIKDFHQEIDVYEKTGALIQFLDNWECPAEETIDDCTIILAEEFALRDFWGEADARLVKLWIQDLRSIQYPFPSRRDSSADYPISTEDKGMDRLHNCRRTHIELYLDRSTDSETPAIYRAATAIRDYSELSKWCAAAHYQTSSGPPDFVFHSPDEIAEDHATALALQQKLQTVLILTNNYRWRFGLGLLQRMYESFFAIVIFCGPYDQRKMDSSKEDKYPPIRGRINYVDLSESEMRAGYHGYYCLAKVKDMRLQNVKGYFMVADDAIFNIWHPLDLSIAHHRVRNEGAGPWWHKSCGLAAAKQSISLIKERYRDNVEVQDAWKQYGEGLAHVGYNTSNGARLTNATSQLLEIDGWIISDWSYIPATNISYVGTLSEIFYEAALFHEIVFSKLLFTIPHQLHRRDFIRYLWSDRGSWSTIYNPTLLSLHPVKMSSFADASAPSRGLFCNTILSTMHQQIFFTNKSEARD